MSLAFYGSNENNDESATAIVSSPSRSEYIRPFEKNMASLSYDGCYWAMAHYLNPIPVKQFQLTASNPNDLTTSTIYQNPGWSTIADGGAEY